MTSGVESFQAILLAFCFALRILYLYAMMAIKYLKLQNLLFHTMEKQTSIGQEQYIPDSLEDIWRKGIPICTLKSFAESLGVMLLRWVFYCDN